MLILQKIYGIIFIHSIHEFRTRLQDYKVALVDDKKEVNIILIIKNNLLS